MQTRNVLTIKEVRSFTGKCTSIATLLYMWRPFLTQLWASLCESQSNAPENCLWLKQISTTLDWLRAFIEGQRGTITRTFTYEASFGVTNSLEITVDASIYGYGAWLSQDGVPLQWFSDDITETDELMLGVTAGDNKGQQAFEAMALLIATREWSHLWRAKRVSLKLKSDNVGALTIFAACKGKSGSMNAVAREYALDACEGAYAPDVVAHLPGVANTTADLLSRRNDPKYAKTWAVPPLLVNAVRIHPAPRPKSWWRAKITPGIAFTRKKGVIHKMQS